MKKLDDGATAPDLSDVIWEELERRHPGIQGRALASDDEEFLDRYGAEILRVLRRYYEAEGGGKGASEDEVWEWGLPVLIGELEKLGEE